jgi:branched-chain amino acid aminotransferase
MPKVPETEFVWRNGKLIKWADATIHALSHVVHYGSSVFEGIRAYATPKGPAVFRLKEHIRRLTDSAKIYHMDVSYSADELAQATAQTIVANKLGACYIRPVIFRGYGTVGVDPLGASNEVFIFAYPWGAYLGENSQKEGVDVMVSSWNRVAPNTIPAFAKAGGNYLNSQLMKIEARANGFVEAIALDTRGFVSEGSGENLFAVRNGTLYTPPLVAAILPGITRDTIITIARERGLRVEETDLPREMLYVADELFFCGTAVEVTPVRSVDRLPVGNGKPGPITRDIQTAYMAAVTGQMPGKQDWLYHVGED